MEEKNVTEKKSNLWINDNYIYINDNDDINFISTVHNRHMTIL